MNNTWSQYVQGTNTLYLTRRLRFDDAFRSQYLPRFALDETRPLRILEIGCGPGALAGALHRWYPKAGIIGLDRDTEFVRFAREHEPGVTFVEGDATALPFPDGSVDVTISNTVSEHIEPSLFFGEQLRVLKPGGVCLVLSARRGIHAAAACMEPTEEEKAFWEKVGRADDSMSRYAVCQYPLSEAELPAAMERFGFTQLASSVAVIDLTPDHPRFPADMARAMIEALRQTTLEAVDTALRTTHGAVSEAEAVAVKELTNRGFDRRLALYEKGEKQWDTAVSITQIVRGVKAEVK